MTRPILLATLTVFGVAVATAVVATHAVGTPAPSAKDTAPKRRLPAKTTDPVDTIVAQLHRRFTDTRDVDFGFDRVSRPKVRMHFGPIMDKNDLAWDDWEGGKDTSGFDPRFIRERNDALEMKTEDGTWIPYDDAREQMRPENATEKQAIASVLKAKREIAIYTFGLFEKGETQRARGPAYLRQKGPKAPEADDIKAVANAAWSGGVPDLPGFRVRAEKVFAKPSCIKCHNEMSVDGEGRPRASYKSGDVLGLILIAEKK